MGKKIDAAQLAHLSFEPRGLRNLLPRSIAGENSPNETIAL
jgi:hypothetical protein